MIQIKRKTLGGLEYRILLNTRYIIEIRPVTEDEERQGKPKTKIVYDTCKRDDVAIIYTSESVSSIKGKITKGLGGDSDYDTYY